jgi:hypothetical protein
LVSMSSFLRSLIVILTSIVNVLIAHKRRNQQTGLPVGNPFTAEADISKYGFFP